MEGTQAIRRIKKGDKKIKLEIAMLIDEHFYYKTAAYFGWIIHQNPDRIVRWVQKFIRDVKAGRIKRIEGSIEHYFWTLKWKRLYRESQTVKTFRVV